jgi:hypothetical protein
MGDAVADAVESHESILEDALGAFEGVFQTTDPVSLARTFTGAMARAARRPVRAAPAFARCGLALGVVGVDTAARVIGVHLPGVSHADSKDPRFRAPAWSDNFAFHGVMESYVAVARLLRELVHAARLEGTQRAKAEFATSLIADGRVGTTLRDRWAQSAARRPKLRSRRRPQRRLARAGRPQRLRAR